MKKFIFMLLVCSAAFGQNEFTSIKIKNTPTVIDDETKVDVLVREKSGPNAGMVRRVTWDYIKSVVGGGDYIPLSGTTEGNPMTGGIELLYDSDFKGFYQENTPTVTTRIGIDDSPVMATKDSSTGYTTSLAAGLNSVLINAGNPLSKGIEGGQDYTANITDLDYVQKKYVDAYHHEYPEATYTETVTWTGTAPSGTTTATWGGTRTGKKVELWINSISTTGGTSNTAVEIPLPTGAPTPRTITGRSATNDLVLPVNGVILTSTTMSVQSNSATLKKTATGYNVLITATSGARVGFSTIVTYWIE